MNILITGANRGIGLGFVNHYLAKNYDVWACYRRDAGELMAIKNDKLHLLEWDVSQSFPADVSQPLPETIDVLINNAGIYGPASGAGQTLESVSDTTLHDVFDIDCLGAIRVVQCLLPAIKKGKGVIANLSSKMGSSEDNSSGGCYAYRAAKAALIIVSKSMAVDLKPSDVHVITLHPGWVRTDMTDHSGLIDVQQSVAGMADVILHSEDYEPGAFIAFDGNVIPY